MDIIAEPAEKERQEYFAKLNSVATEQGISVRKIITHDVLKERAKALLRDMGFQEDQIKREYVVNAFRFTTYRIDVVGLSPERKVAVECGQVHRRKIMDLLLVFDDVYHVPYPDQTPLSLTLDEAKLNGVERIKFFEMLSEQYQKVADEIRATTGCPK